MFSLFTIQRKVTMELAKWIIGDFYYWSTRPAHNSGPYLFSIRLSVHLYVPTFAKEAKSHFGAGQVDHWRLLVFYSLFFFPFFLIDNYIGLLLLRHVIAYEHENKKRGCSFFVLALRITLPNLSFLKILAEIIFWHRVFCGVLCDVLSSEVSYIVQTTNFKVFIEVLWSDLKLWSQM